MNTTTQRDPEPASPAALRLQNLSRREQWAVTWAFWWRGIIIGVASTLAGAVAGIVVGLVWQIVRTLLGVTQSPEAAIWTARVLGGTAGAVSGLLLLWVYMRWLFGSRLGGFRLRLERDSDAA